MEFSSLAVLNKLWVRQFSLYRLTSTFRRNWLTPRPLLSKDISQTAGMDAGFLQENNVFSFRRPLICRMSSEGRKLYGYYSEVVTWAVCKYSEGKARIVLHQNTTIQNDIKHCVISGVFWNILVIKLKFLV